MNTVSEGYYGFTDQDHVDLAKLLVSVKGKWLMTYDESESLRTLYRNFQIRTITSSLASQKVSRGTHRIPLKQLLISNFKIGE
jgi:DNA adenine methylase